MVSVSLQARTTDSATWLDLARRAEQLGFDALTAADHPGASAAPFVALAAAGAVTERIGLGSYVTNGGVREPAHIAADVATLDVVSGGRARLGLGAGHTPAEWRAVGRERPDVAGRVERCIAVVEAVQALLAGESVDADGPVVARGATLAAPRPVQDRIPLTIGTSNSRLLRFAGARADVVGLSGLGRTLPDGHNHTVRWRPEDVDAQVGLVAEGAAGRDHGPELEALVQLLVVTDDAGAAVRDLATEIGLSEADLLTVPYVLAGTEDEIVAAVTEHKRRWGITRYVVRAADMLDDMATLLPRLAEL
ncbi:LLM class flavin-dependent oxidoreductase [Georgenia subflava]|uniref:LLM class flavin-dependent oxidoreductase n=1 Tax=Georgenia subflava TaxID=1622177 RepID=A0A6N7EID1_9MICO|nr:LLM class flavin-dependent oxidoreductase [Georgenia subflava]MPV36375.1 LLM class flavin-dependent oxidoreductase [Georgenia subflava]